MSEVQPMAEGDVVTYQPGIRFRSIVRAALGRFLPASFLSGVGLLTYMNGWTVIHFAYPLGLAGGLTLGYGLGLTILSRWLYPDAEVAGRRSVLAGLLAPLGLFGAVAVTGGRLSVGEVPWVLALCGLIAAFVFFFAWLTSTPESMRDSKYLEGGIDGEPVDPARAPAK